MRQRARIALLLPSLAFSLDACAGGPGALPPVACRVGEPGASADTLSVEIHLDSLPTGGGGRVLARVDALEDGFVEFEGGGPQAAAAGLQVTPAGRLLGCAGEAPSGFRFITAARHLDKAWLRVSSERPVRVGVRAADGSALDAPDQVIRPGESAVLSWTRSAP